MIGLIGFGAIWGATWYLTLPRALVWGLSGLWLAVLLVTTSPYWFMEVSDAPPLVGGDFVGWVTFGFLGMLVAGYRVILGRLRARVPVIADVAAGKMRPAELDRYARHIMLREIGGVGQRSLRDAKVLVVGAGGLGSPALLYLAAAGVGTIGVIDDDMVDNSNLQRQVIHTDARIGMDKVQSAMIAMRALNPFIVVRPYKKRLTEDIAEALIADYDLVLDGSDNFDTRYLVNAVCVQAGKPLVAGAITQWEGQVAVYHAPRGPCYACIFPVRPAPGLVPTCAEAGVVAALPGVIGAMMAIEAIKHITQAGEGLVGRLMIYDALYGEVRVIGTKRRGDCTVCGAGH
jgi:molybdopterin/thiamine biosynthesis adenylyltransferase